MGGDRRLPDSCQPTKLKLYPTKTIPSSFLDTSKPDDRKKRFLFETVNARRPYSFSLGRMLDLRNEFKREHLGSYPAW
jgi:hypothetical protein